LISSHPNTQLPQGTDPDIVKFYFYWLSLPKSGLLPRLSDYLDHAPPELQPFVGISDVYSPIKQKLRLLGTGLVSISGKDPTGAELGVLYVEKVKKQMGQLAWDVVSRPVGYLCVRDLRTTSGRIVHGPSICLPLANPTSPAAAVITYTHVEHADTSFPGDDRAELVQNIRVTHWIDLGAGVPS